MSKQNKTLVSQTIDVVYNQGNLAAIDELVADDLVIHTASHDFHGPDGARQLVSTLRTAFPDLRLSIQDQFADGDRVATRWSARATHNGTFQGIPATGRQVHFQAIDIDRVVGSKVVECWINLDELGLLRQLGIESNSSEDKDE